jgi:hypothetical protein
MGFQLERDAARDQGGQDSDATQLWVREYVARIASPVSHTHAGEEIATGTVAPARLGSGSGGSSKFLREDSTWQTVSGGSTPTGTGFRHVTAGVEDAAAKLVDTADINADQVTFAKIQNSSAASKLLGRGSAAGAGDFEEITLGTNLSMSGTTLNATGGGSTPTGTGFVHVTGGVQDGAAKLVDTADVNNDQITYGKMQNVSAASMLLGRGDSGSGDPEEITLGASLSMSGKTLNVVSAFTRINGATGTAGADKTLQKLSSNASANSTTTLATVMTTEAVGAGTWQFKYCVIYQAAATSTGVNFAVNHTGTVTKMVCNSWLPTSGGTAANGLGLQAGTDTANLVEGKSARTKDTKMGATLGVDAANSNMLIIIEGVIVISVSGSLELRHASEVAASTQVMAETCLELTKIG